jgi:predicted nucleotidyltransferase component of viral defense system
METYFKRIKYLTLISLFSDNDLLDILVLKGGTALEFYDLDYRLSLDLDFSIEKEFDQDLTVVHEKIETVLRSTFREEGYEVFDIRVLEKPSKYLLKWLIFGADIQLSLKL